MTDLPSDEELARIGVRLDAAYYAITVVADQEGRVVTSTQSHWTGWADEHCTWEYRRASEVEPSRFVAAHRGRGVEPRVINDVLEFLVFRFFEGGVALVRTEIADKYLASLVGRRKCIARPGGYTGEGLLGESASARFARGRLRMRVFKRDGFRCLICGRTAADALDVKLHAHHIRGFAAAGPTVEWNLATLCESCHDGIEEDDRAVQWRLATCVDPIRIPSPEEFQTDIARFREQAPQRLRMALRGTRKGRSKRRPSEDFGEGSKRKPNRSKGSARRRPSR